MPCILTATSGIILYLNYKKSEITEFREIMLFSTANLCPPHCEQTQRPSHIVFVNPQRSAQMAQQPFEQCSLERLVSMYMYIHTHIHICTLVRLLIPCFLLQRETAKAMRQIFQTINRLKTNEEHLKKRLDEI